VALVRRQQRARHELFAFSGTWQRWTGRSRRRARRRARHLLVHKDGARGAALTILNTFGNTELHEVCSDRVAHPCSMLNIAGVRCGASSFTANAAGPLCIEQRSIDPEAQAAHAPSLSQQLVDISVIEFARRISGEISNNRVPRSFSASKRISHYP
jgi:hypothetical protein